MYLTRIYICNVMVGPHHDPPVRENLGHITNVHVLCDWNVPTWLIQITLQMCMGNVLKTFPDNKLWAHLRCAGLLFSQCSHKWWVGPFLNVPTIFSLSYITLKNKTLYKCVLHYQVSPIVYTFCMCPEFSHNVHGSSSGWVHHNMIPTSNIDVRVGVDIVLAHWWGLGLGLGLGLGWGWGWGGLGCGLGLGRGQLRLGSKLCQGRGLGWGQGQVKVNWGWGKCWEQCL